MYELDMIVGPKGYRHLGEIRHFTGLSDFRTVLFTSKGNRPVGDETRYQNVSEQRILPDLVAERLVRKPYGPVSFIQFGWGVRPRGDTINAAELYSFGSAQAVKLASNKASKVVISSWETIASNPLYFFPPYIFNVARVKAAADIFLVPTSLAARCLLSLSIPHSKIRKVRPGIDIDYFFRPRRQHATFRILFVGRLDPEKGVDVLIRAFLNLCRDRKEVELWICGPSRSGGRLESMLRLLSQKYPIRLIGEVPQDQLREIYSSCDVLCFPSVDRWKWGRKIWEEQFGWTLVEAMASGLPIVATHCGAIREVVGDHNIIVKQNSSEDLLNAFRKLMDNGSYLAYLSKSNHDRARDLYDIRKQRQELDKALVHLVEGR